MECNAPSVYALGMGGVQNKLPRILKKMDWKVVVVPFYFRVCRAARVLRPIKPMRSTPLRRALCDMAAFTGLGAPAFGLKQWWNRRQVRDQCLAITEEPHFGPWCDPIWAACHASYGCIGQRDSATLPIFFTDDEPRFIRMHLRRDGNSIGWVLALCTDMQNHKQFGNLRVASLVDAMVLPGDAATTRHLEERHPDIIVSNQQHAAWREAQVRAGFQAGPSHYALVLSPAACAGLHARSVALTAMHLNRGDGPINL